MQSSAAYDDNYRTCVSTSARLRVMGEELDPQAITLALGVEPTRTQVRGELPAPGSNHPYKYSGWFLETQGNVQSRDVRRHIDWLLSKVVGKGETFSKLRSEGHLTDVCCPWFSIGQGGPTLGAAQMSGLSELGVELWFDVYFAEEDRVV